MKTPLALALMKNVILKIITAVQVLLVYLLKTMIQMLPVYLMISILKPIKIVK